MNRRILYLAALISFAAIGGAPAQTDTGALAAKSAALSPDQKAQAQQLFATSFSLWQSGDFAAAEIGFKKGLDIDPANALANYYYGDCLARRKDKAEAKDYLSRAVALGGTSIEALKANAELQQLAATPTNVADMTDEDLKTNLVGTWNMVWSGGNSGTITIMRDAGGPLMVTSAFRSFTFKTIQNTTNQISMNAGAMFVDAVIRGKLVTPNRMEGSVTFDSPGPQTWYADKR